MKIIYLVMCIIIIILLASRKFNFLTLGCGSFILYTSFCLVGEVSILGGRTGVYYFSNVSAKTYVLIIAQLATMIIVLLCSNKFTLVFSHNKTRDYLLQNTEENRENEDDIEWFWTLMLFFCSFCIFYTVVIEVGIGNFFSYIRKQEIQSQMGYLYSPGVWGSIICFTHYIQRNNKSKTVIALLLLLITVIHGGRAYFTTALIAFFIVKSKDAMNIIKSNVKLIAVGGISLSLLLIYKNIYRAVRALDWGMVISILKDPAIYEDLFEITEFKINLSIYNYIVDSGFTIPFKDTVARLVSVIPFASDLVSKSLPIRTSQIIQNTFFHSSYGLANSFWAELYAMGGVVFLLLGTAIWMIILNKSSRKLLFNKKVSPFLLTIIIYCSFYIHRLDFVQVSGCIKSVGEFYVLWLICRHIKMPHRR